MCKACGGKGFIESWHGGAGYWTSNLQQCSKRCNLSGYSAEVQKRLNSSSHVTKRQPVMAMPSEQPSQAQEMRHTMLRLVR